MLHQPKTGRRASSAINASRASHFRILYPIVSSSTWPNPAMACLPCLYMSLSLSKMLFTSNERAREIYPPHSVS